MVQFSASFQLAHSLGQFSGVWAQVVVLHLVSSLLFSVAGESQVEVLLQLCCWVKSLMLTKLRSSLGVPMRQRIET